MTTFVRCCALAVVVAVLTLTLPAAAQMKVEVSAILGYYSPMGSFQSAPANSTRLPNGPGDLSGIALGGQLRLWVAPRIGLELGANTTPSGVGGRPGVGYTPRSNGGPVPDGSAQSPVNARVSAATAQFLYAVLRTNPSARVWLSAGAAVVRHGGEAYAPYGNPMNFGGVVGVGSAFRIKGPLSAELGLTTLIYRMNLRGSSNTDPGVRERGTQTDALLNTGVSYGWH